MLVLVAMLLAAQPAAPLVRAQETAPPTFVVVGVAGATLRAEPNGSSAALAVVPAGASVTLAGTDVVSHGTAWRQVRTTEGVVGYLPVAFLTQTGGAPVAVPAVQATAPSSSNTSATAGGTQPRAAAADAARTGTAARGPDPTPVPTAPPTAAPTPPRTTVERRRGQDVRITHQDKERAPDGREMGSGRIVVKFKPGANQTVRADTHRVAGAATTEAMRLPETVVAKVPAGTVNQALAAYRARPDVEWAEPDYVRRATTAPNDPDFVAQQWNVQKIGAHVAWEATTATAGIKIAILDCGIYSESSTFRAPDGGFGHPDLRTKVMLESNFTNTQDVDDWCDHGTLMAGIAGARSNNSVGITGVGFNASVMNAKVLDDNGEGFDSWIANGIVWATNNGASVISMSLGGDGACSSTLQNAINHAWGSGAVIVAAAGNGGTDGVGDALPEAPGSCNHVIPVGAIDRHDQRASFSNYNANPNAGPVVPLAAPGVDIYSTDYRGFYSLVDGTSPATPHVAGVAALIRALHPNESNATVVHRLISTAAPIVGTGTFWANGRLDAPAALAGVACSPRPNISVTSQSQGNYSKVTLTANGLGNAIRFVQVNGTAGTPVNGTLVMPSSFDGAPDITALDWGGAQTFVPAQTDKQVVMRLSRTTPNTPTTVPFKVQDACGSWQTFVGGGTSAGF
jgi:thermitase